MINIAIVEDNELDVKVFLNTLARYEYEHGEKFNITKYKNAIDFLSGNKCKFDIVFMDIEMPIMNGIEASEKLREPDKTTMLIFVTNLTQYAIKGYEVNAFDYIVKPINYYNFSLKLQRAIDIILNNERDKVINIAKASGYVRLKIRDIVYIEVTGHRVVYHLSDSEIEAYGTLKNISKDLEGENFMRCNNFCLINPLYITKVKGYTVTVNGQDIPISRTKKKAFMEELSLYIAKGSK